MDCRLSADLIAEHYKTFYEYFQTKTLCDVILVCDDGIEISAHRNILAAESFFFLKLFDGSFKDSKEERVAIKEIESDVLQCVVTFAYTFQLKINEQNIEKFLKAATFFDLKHSENVFVDCVKTYINPTNCIGLMKTTKLLTNKELSSFCFSYVLNKFSEIVNSDTGLKILNELYFDDIEMLISNDNLVVESEEKVFDFVIGWIMYRTSERSRYLPDLIKYLILPLIPKNKLQRILCNEPLITNDKECILEVTKQIINNIGSSNRSNRKPYSDSIERNIIFAISGALYKPSYHVKCMIIEDGIAKWKDGPLIFCPRLEDATLVASENGILLAIGVDKTRRPYTKNVTISVEVLDLKSSLMWESTTSMNKFRTKFATCTNKRFIYVVGGMNERHEILDSVEYYDSTYKHWTDIVKPMSIPRASCSAIVHNDQLYVFGGRHSTGVHASVESYDFIKDHWMPLDPLPKVAYNMTITKGISHLHLINGYKHFKLNLEDFKWEVMPEMQMDTAISKALIIENKLYVIVKHYMGGANWQGRRLDKDEVICIRFVHEENNWQLVESENAPTTPIDHLICFNGIQLNSFGIII